MAKNYIDLAIRGIGNSITVNIQTELEAIEPYPEDIVDGYKLMAIPMRK